MKQHFSVDGQLELGAIVTRRFTDTISPDNPIRVYNLDFDAYTLTILNTSQYTVYVNIGNANTPGPTGRNVAISPFSSYVGSVAGSRAFGVFVDHAGDINPSYVYPITVTFSEITGDASSPLSGFFPTNQPIATITRYTGAQAGSDGGEVTFNRMVYDYAPGLNTTSSRLDFNGPALLNVTITLSFSAMTAITSISLYLKRQVPGQAQKDIIFVIEFPASGQMTTTLTLSKIVSLIKREQIWATLFFTGTSVNIDAGGTLVLKQLA